MVPLSGRDAEVYYSSPWYLDQIGARRRKLIADGFITFADDHPNNPASSRFRVVLPVTHLH